MHRGSARARCCASLADLAPANETRQRGLTIPTDWFRWLPANAVSLFMLPPGSPSAETLVDIDRTFGERLASVDRIRPQQHSLRLGWLFVAGTLRGADGRRRRTFRPLVTMPVRVELPPLLGSAKLRPVGDVSISNLIDDPAERRALEARMQFGGGALVDEGAAAIAPALLARLTKLSQFARAAASAASLPASVVVPVEDAPDQLADRDGLVIVAGVGVYATHEPGSVSRAGSLRGWADGPLDRWTSFHSLYVDDEVPPAGEPSSTSEPVVSPYLLTPVQRAAVLRSRTEPVTLVSGAPGTGKSHTVVAIACDAIARGESVLVAAKSDATVDALIDLLERTPGPEPVVFGSNERRTALAERLAGGQLVPLDDSEVDAARHACDEATTAEVRAWRSIEQLLAAEAEAGDPGSVGQDVRQAAPGFFSPDADIPGLFQLLDEAVEPAGGWWSRRRRRRRLRELRTRAQSSSKAPLDVLQRALESAAGVRAAQQLTRSGGLEVGERWEELLRLSERAREAVGRSLAAASRSRQRLNRSTLPSVAAVAMALRSGRAARRTQLAQLDPSPLIWALPLWVGSLPDIDDLLPAVPGYFDLVVLDEASSIDQLLAVPALLRARRAVVVGDPRQLRHVSFQSDERLAEVIAHHRLADEPTLVARVDVRRNSLFDVAAGASPVLTLDEHFRSAPHLVDFVARRLYEGAVKVATRAPSTCDEDCVEVVRLAGTRDRTGVVEEEITAAMRELRSLLARGIGSVGLMTPFRAQADALERAVLERFTVHELAALDLRVGTVHGFQGNERDVVIVSLAIGPDQDSASWRFVEDPHLFAVLATRARKQMTLLLSSHPPPGGLVADYLEQADDPPGPPSSAAPATPWANEIADDLASAGVPVIASYPTGRHIVDLCVPVRGQDIAVECGVHPHGANAHVDRHLALRRSGWTIIEAFPSRWSGRRGELVVELLEHLGAPETRPTLL